MKCYAIKDDSIPSVLTVGYLFYYEQSRRFYIEIPREIDEWQAPFIMAGLVRRGIRSADHRVAGKWVASRIVPPDRQNLGMILKANRLKEYDAHRLLVLADGRCAQDECFIEPIDPETLPDEILARSLKKVREITALSGFRLLVLFRGGMVRMIPMKKLLSGERRYARILADEDLFAGARISPGGNGIEWDEERFVPAGRLALAGRKQDMTAEDMLLFSEDRLVDAAGVARILGCSRQYVSQLIGSGRLSPVAVNGTGRKYFLKGDALSLME